MTGNLDTIITKLLVSKNIKIINNISFPIAKRNGFNCKITNSDNFDFDDRTAMFVIFIHNRKKLRTSAMALILEVGSEFDGI